MKERWSPEIVKKTNEKIIQNPKNDAGISQKEKSVEYLDKKKVLWEEYENLNKIISQEYEKLDQAFQEFHKLIGEKKEYETLLNLQEERNGEIVRAVNEHNCVTLYSKEELLHLPGKTARFFSKTPFVSKLVLEPYAEVLAKKEVLGVMDLRGKLLDSIDTLNKRLQLKKKEIDMQKQKLEDLFQKEATIIALGSKEGDVRYGSFLKRVEGSELEDIYNIDLLAIK